MAYHVQLYSGPKARRPLAMWEFETEADATEFCDKLIAASDTHPRREELALDDMWLQQSYPDHAPPEDLDEKSLQEMLDTLL